MRRSTRLIHYVLLCYGIGSSLAGAASAADITGQVALPDGRPARDAVVYLDGGKRARPMDSAVVDQRDKTFIPHVCVVTRGTKVRFPNNDTVFHNVFAYYQATKFDLGMYPRGATKTVLFDKVGLVCLLCNVHSNMSAYIIVVDTPYYAVTDRQGRFRIHDVPGGRYTLHAWHESGAKLTQAVNLTTSLRTLALSLTRR